MAKDYYIIGVDIGATKINTVLINRQGRLIKKLKLKTKERREEIIEQILESIEKISGKNVIGIGIGVPGILDKKRKKIIKLPNLQEWENISLKKIVEKKFNKKVLLENDANCMALGESMFGHGKNVKNLVCITIGTGIGGGIIINNKIYSGRSSAGEFGHITIDSNGYKCKCGARGCLEEYISTRGIERIVKSGNKKPKKFYETAGTYLGIGLATIIKVLDPDLILIGGGISNAGDFLLNPAVKEMKKRTFFKTCSVKVVKLKDNAGAIGAACLFLKKTVK